MSKKLIGFWLAAGLAAVLLLGVGINTFGRYTGRTVSKLDPTTLSRLLAPYYQVFRPQGAGPFPTALLFSGCDGPKDNLNRWAATLNREGWAAIIVDSHAPRGFNQFQLWRLICMSQLLNGAERAGDIAGALDDARALPFVDAKQIVLIGASHGGWSILEFLSLYANGQVPYNLTAWPESINRNGLNGISGIVLLYPYCGPLSLVSHRGWQYEAPVKFILVEHDTITDENDCIALIGKMRERGLNVTFSVFKNVTHGFDQKDRSVLSRLEFNPEANARALEEIAAFLSGLSSKVDTSRSIP
jgi:dienelactone hydrolase